MDNSGSFNYSQNNIHIDVNKMVEDAKKQAAEQATRDALAQYKQNKPTGLNMSMFFAGALIGIFIGIAFAIVIALIANGY